MDQSDQTILVLEDQQFIAIDLEDLLMQDGFESLVLLSTCAAAEEWLRGNSPDVAILDIELQDGMCVEVARTLTRRGVPFIVHSAKDEGSEGANTAFLKGKWIGKPCPPAILIGAVNDILNLNAG